MYIEEIKKMKENWTIYNSEEMKSAVERIAALGSSVDCFQKSPELVITTLAIFYGSECESRELLEYKQYLSNKLNEAMYAPNVTETLKDDISRISQTILTTDYNKSIPILLMLFIKYWDILFCNVLVYRILEIIIRCSTLIANDTLLEKLKVLGYVALENAENYAVEHDCRVA